jgi:hypothetical protein
MIFMFLMRADTILYVGKWWGGFALEISSFVTLWAPVKWHEPKGECHSGPKPWFIEPLVCFLSQAEIFFAKLVKYFTVLTCLYGPDLNSDKIFVCEFRKKNKVTEPDQDLKSHNVVRIFAHFCRFFFSPPPSPRHVAVRTCTVG